MDNDAGASQVTDEEIVDLTVAIGPMNTCNRIAVSFRRGPRPPDES